MLYEHELLPVWPFSGCESTLSKNTVFFRRWCISSVCAEIIHRMQVPLVHWHCIRAKESSEAGILQMLTGKGTINVKMRRRRSNIVMPPRKPVPVPANCRNAKNPAFVALRDVQNPKNPPIFCKRSKYVQNDSQHSVNTTVNTAKMLENPAFCHSGH